MELEWAIHFGGTGTDSAAKIAVDNDGNFVCLVAYSGTADMDASENEYIISAELSGHHLALVKYSPQGDFIWAVPIGTTPYSIAGGIAIDNNNNIIVVGSFLGMSDFDPGDSEFWLAAQGGLDVFILKLNAVGDFVQAVSLGGITTDSVNDIALDNDNNIVLIGEFAGTVDFDPNPNSQFLVTSSAEPGDFLHADAYLLKLDENLDFMWVKTFGVAGQSDKGNSVKIDSENHIWITGYYYNELAIEMLDGFTDTIFAYPPSYATFLIKMNADGLGLKLRSFGQQAASLDGKFLRPGFDGEMFFVGTCSNGMQVETVDGVVSLPSCIFVMHMDDNMDINWIQSIQGTGSRGARGISFSETGIIWISGYFTQTLALDNNSTVLTSSGDVDGFLVSFDNEGNTFYTMRFGSTQSDYGNDVIGLSSNQVVLVGSMNGEVDFGIGGVPHVLTSNGNSDAFIIKLANDTTDQKIVSIEQFGDIRVWPNPSNGVFSVSVSDGWQNELLRLYDFTGREVYRSRLLGRVHTTDISHLPSGMYVAQIGSGREVRRVKLVRE